MIGDPRFLSLTWSMTVLFACGPDELTDDPASADGKADGSSSIAKVEIERYEYELDLASRRSAQTLHLEVEGFGRCVELPYASGQPEAVAINGQAATARLEDGMLIACRRSGQRSLLPWTSATLSVSSIVPEGQLGTTMVGWTTVQDSTMAPVTYLLNWLGQCGRFGACETRPDRFATFHLGVSHPAGTRVLCPGEIVATATRTTCTLDLEAPIYSALSFIASPNWTETSLGSLDGVRTSVFDLPGTGATAKLQAAELGGLVAFLQQQFGPYPWGSDLRFVMAPTAFSGFEHPGNIVLKATLPTAPSWFSDGTRHFAMHELVHQWAGNWVTLEDEQDFTWKEGMAEYLTYVYEAEHLAPDVAARTLSSWKTMATLPNFSNYYLVPRPWPGLYVESQHGRFSQQTFGTSPFILFRQLEVRFGRPAILEAIADVLSRDSRTASMDDLKDALEDAVDEDLDDYFDAWVYGSGVPAYPRATVTRTDAGGGKLAVTLALTTADGKRRGGKLVVRLQGAAGETLDVPFDFGLDGEHRSRTTVVTPGFVVTAHVLDPLSQALIYPAP